MAATRPLGAAVARCPRSARASIVPDDGYHRFHFYHSEGSNVAFWDSHVKW